MADVQKALTRLLCINVEEYSDDELLEYVKQRFIQWFRHTYTEENRYQESLLNELKQVWITYSKGKSLESPFEICTEISQQSAYTQSYFDEDFFTPNINSGLEFPDFANEFLRSVSNRRKGKIFIVLTEDVTDKVEAFYKICFPVDFFGAFKKNVNNVDCILILIKFVNDIGLNQVRKIMKKICLASESAYAVRFNDLLKCLKENCGNTYFEPKSLCVTDNDEKEKFNHKALVDFAIKFELHEVFEVMEEYAHLSTPCDRPLHAIDKDHEESHIEELINAKIYVRQPDRKRLAKNACDAVAAKMFTTVKHLSNADILNEKCRELGDKLSFGEFDICGEADFFRKYIMCESDFKGISKEILETFTIGKCKHRYVCLTGKYNSGKTTFAHAFNTLFNGANINVNIDKSRLPFYMGSAIGKRYVLFDDVKGNSDKRNVLTKGCGFTNLDDMRDYLDGHVPIQLEKKNQNPVTQIFPAGLITCNQYDIPPALQQRIKIFEFKAGFRYKYHPISLDVNRLYVALVLQDLLPAHEDVRAYFIRNKNKWWTEHIKSGCECINADDEDKENTTPIVSQSLQSTPIVSQSLQSTQLKQLLRGKILKNHGPSWLTERGILKKQTVLDDSADFSTPGPSWLDTWNTPADS